MYEILRKKILNPQVKLMEISAPLIARKAEPGQFIILRVDERGERIPLTIAGYDRDKGTVTIIFQEAGKTTRSLGSLREGNSILDFTGPLGNASHFDDSINRAVVIGGGLGTAIAYPQAKKLYEMGVGVDSICGFRTKELVILQEEMREVSARFFLTTDDGSAGNKGFVTDQLKDLIEQGNRYDLCIVIGPLVMMKYICELTRRYGIKTVVSMNPIMIDGTGMCGGCRVTVGGETRFACVDGPDFDGHQVDFDEAIRRQQMYLGQEKQSMDMHTCRLKEKIKNA